MKPNLIHTSSPSHTEFLSYQFVVNYSHTYIPQLIFTLQLFAADILMLRGLEL